MEESSRIEPPELEEAIEDTEVLPETVRYGVAVLNPDIPKDDRELIGWLKEKEENDLP